jgi:hypothetical protein
LWNAAPANLIRKPSTCSSFTALNQVYYMPEFFGVLDDLVKAGKLRFYGVSVEKVEEALKAIEYPNVQSVQSSSTCSVIDLLSFFSSRPRSVK